MSPILVLNSGSSSLKFALFDRGGAASRIAWGAVEAIARDGGRLWLRTAADGVVIDRAQAAADPAAAIDLTLAALASARLAAPEAVGHRLVHGGPLHHAPTRVDAALLAALRDAVVFAPIHLPAAVAGIAAVSARFPGLPQVACFDTDFHHALPEVARRLPMSRAIDARGLRRYGFHGLSYESVVDSVGAAQLGRAVIAHLGNGASMAAVVDGVSHDTTMGLTPTGGLMMGTRTGDLDPGVLLHLLRTGEDAGSLERIVDHESGLLGVSGRTADVKALLALRGGDRDAALAIDMFCHHACKAVGALTATMGGIDTLVFTGGIGEHAAAVRAQICGSLAHLGIAVDAARNAAADAIISVDRSPCTVRVVQTDEERIIARHTARLLGALDPS